jgi:formate dehydrogenase maturation protein FdhE
MKNKYIATAISLLITSLITGQVNVENKTQTKADAIVFSKSEREYQQVQKELQQLEQQKKQLLALMELYNEKQKKLLPRIEKLENIYDSTTKTNIAAETGGSQNQLLNATKQMQETQMNFNVQYLLLQEHMQNENQTYTAISNIMKTKHDTVKNSISNVR